MEELDDFVIVPSPDKEGSPEDTAGDASQRDALAVLASSRGTSPEHLKDSRSTRNPSPHRAPSTSASMLPDGDINTAATKVLGPIFSGNTHRGTGRQVLGSRLTRKGSSANAMGPIGAFVGNTHTGDGDQIFGTYASPSDELVKKVPDLLATIVPDPPQEIPDQPPNTTAVSSEPDRASTPPTVPPQPSSERVVIGPTSYKEGDTPVFEGNVFDREAGRTQVVGFVFRD